MIRALKPKARSQAAYTRPLANRVNPRSLINAKITPADVVAIRREYKTMRTPMRKLGKRYDLSATSIHAAIHGHTWKSVMEEA